MRRALDIARYHRDIAKPRRKRDDAARAARLLLKAVRSLPERERDLVLAYLVERAIAPPTGGDAGEAPPRAFVPGPSQGIFLGHPAPSMAPPLSEWLSPSLKIARMLLSGQRVEDAARADGVSEDAIRTALRREASRPDLEEPLPSILRLVADGRPLAEARQELGASKEELNRMLRRLMPVEPAGSSRFVPASSPGGPQQMVPVRFPEAQHQRLKDWCLTHGFSMAVVVRGLVERFLDDQERRAA